MAFFAGLVAAHSDSRLRAEESLFKFEGKVFP
jgi:hypothetical protein